jgi:hypothetical protein
MFSAGWIRSLAPARHWLREINAVLKAFRRVAAYPAYPVTAGSTSWDIVGLTGRLKAGVPVEVH